MSYSNIERAKCFSKVFLSLAKANLLKKKIPFMLGLQVTKACNLRCKYCYANLESLQGEDFTLAEIKEILEEFHALGTRAIRILGGEPLIRKDIGEIIRFLRSRDIFIELATNGVFIEHRLDDLRNVDILQVSIDGDKKAHDAVRGEGTYEKAIRGLEAAVKAKLPVRIHGVFNKISIEAGGESQVAGLARLSKRYNVPFNFCQYVVGEEEKQCGVVRKPAYVSFADTRKYHEELIDYKKRGYKFFNSFATMKQIMNWPNPDSDVLYHNEAHKIPSYFSRCRAGELYCFLDSDGSLYTCVALWKKGLNVRKVGAGKAWEVAQKVRDDAGCFSCVSLGDIEFSKAFSLNPNSIINTLTKVCRLNRK